MFHMNISLPAPIQKVLKKINDRPNLRASIIITAVLLCSRLLGMFRLVLINGKMDQEISDVLIGSLLVPELLSTVLISGTVISSVLPVLTRIQKKGKHVSSIYLNAFTYMFAGLIVVLSAAVITWMPWFLRATSGESWQYFADLGLTERYIELSRILMAGPFFFGLTAVMGVFLQVKRRFFVYSLQGVVYNLGSVITLLVSPYNSDVNAAYGFMVGAAAAVVVFVVESLRNGWEFIPIGEIVKNWNVVSMEIRDTWASFLPRIFLVDAPYIAQFLIKFFNQGEAQITVFDVGLAIQGAFMIIITSLDTVFFPKLTSLFNESENKSGFMKELRRIILGIGGLGVVVSLFTIFMAPVVMWVFELLQKGQNNPDTIILVARITSLTLTLRALKLIVGKYFYIHERVWQPVILTLVSVTAQVLFVQQLFIRGVDSLLSVSWSLGVYGVVWLGIAYYYIWNDQRRSVRV